MLDIKITQGEYWGGAQINYWFYVIISYIIIDINSTMARGI
jgi:hypothetical protein